jgi:DNA-binding GntR family transcriptional regulator
MNENSKPRMPAKPVLPEFDEVVPVTRRAQIAETLRSLILSGQFAPGTQIVESELAARFGVSRGSVREAIWELVDQRLVVNRPYSGTYVVETDITTMEEVYSVRGALERHCFSELWNRRGKEFEKEFTARHDILQRAVTSGKRIEAIEAEVHFHSYPYEYAGNSVLIDVWQQLSQKMQLNFVMTQSIVRSNSFLEETRRYLDAALGDDLAAMHAEIDRHLELGVQALQALRTDSDGTN